MEPILPELGISGITSFATQSTQIGAECAMHSAPKWIGDRSTAGPSSRCSCGWRSRVGTLASECQVLLLRIEVCITHDRRNCVLKQTAAEAPAAQMTRDRHLRKLVDAILDGDQRDASDCFETRIRHEDVATLQENRVCRVVQSLSIFRFKSEIPRNPFFIESPERSGVIVWRKRANLNSMEE